LGTSGRGLSESRPEVMDSSSIATLTPRPTRAEGSYLVEQLEIPVPADPRRPEVRQDVGYGDLPWAPLDNKWPFYPWLRQDHVIALFPFDRKPV